MTTETGWQFIYFKPSGKYYTAEEDVTMTEDVFRLRIAGATKAEGDRMFFKAVSELNCYEQKSGKHRLPGLSGKHTELSLVVIAPNDSSFGFPMMWPEGQLIEGILGQW